MWGEAHLERILATFSEKLSSKATRALEGLGVQVWTSKRVTNIDADGLNIGKERIEASTVLWAAGIKASKLNKRMGIECDETGRAIVEPDLSLKGHPEVFISGDQAAFIHQTGKPLPAMAPVAVQQGRFVAKNIIKELQGKPRQNFHYKDKGQLATIGRSKAVLELGRIKLSGFLAWTMWLTVHIYYLMGFKNRIFVLFQWATSYWTFRKGARLVVNKDWRFYNPDKQGD